MEFRNYMEELAMELQFKADVIREIVEALKVVRANHRHQQPSAAEDSPPRRG